MLRASVVILRTILRRRRQMLYNYCYKIFCTWDKSKRTRHRFLVLCSKQLNQKLILPSEVQVLEITAHLGCLKMSFQCSSNKHKPMRDVSAPELPHTAQKNLWFGHRTGCSIASERRMTDPTTALKINVHGKVSYTTYTLHLLQVMKQCHSSWV